MIKPLYFFLITYLTFSITNFCEATAQDNPWGKSVLLFEEKGTGYTRTETTTRCVTILYFHATDRGEAEYSTDISLWNDKRIVPKISTYFNNMNAYHINYAAFATNEYSGGNDYIRLRRYNPNKKRLKGSDVPGDYFQTKLFKPDATYHIQVFRYNNQIKMNIQNKDNTEDDLI